MRQSWRLAASALLVVTGLVTAPSDPAAAWQVDVGDQLTRLMTAGDNVQGTAPQSRREWDSVIHRVGEDDFMTNSRAYAQPSAREQASGDRSERTMSEKAAGEHPLETTSRSGNAREPYPYSSPNSYPYSYPYSSYGGGVPSTPHGDPLVRELNREPAMK